MSNNLLFNIQRILVFVRFDIKNPVNIQFIDAIIACLNTNIENEGLVNLIVNIEKKLKEQLVLERDIEIEYQDNSIKFMLQILEIIRGALKEKNYIMAYDMVDMLHIFPEIIITNQKKGIRSYWKRCVNPILKKWKVSEISDIKRNLYCTIFKCAQKKRLSI